MSEMLNQLDIEKNKIKENVRLNVDQSLFPVLKKT